MKKNFFKKLSFVLALAMIVSVIAPAAGAFAAAATKLNSTTRYLYLGEDGKNEFDFNVINKVKGTKYSFESSNENVAVVDAASGLTDAVGVGKATITLYADSEALTKATVIVKDNIAEIKTIYMQTQDAPKLDQLKVNAAYDFGRTYVTKSGATTGTTSVTRWFVDKADKATVDSVGVFKATEAGTYNITAVAFTSVAKYDAWKALNDTTSTLNVLATKTIEVKVVNEIKDAAQTDLNSIKVTFASPVTDAASEIKVSRLVGTTKVPVAVKPAVAVDATKNVEFTVDAYADFAADTTYVVDYKDLKSVQFVGVKSTRDQVASMTVSTSQVTVGTPKDLFKDVKVFNANGVDITNTSIVTTTNISFATTSTKAYISGSNVSMFKAGDVAEVKATWHSQKYNYTTGAEEGNIDVVVNLTAVDPATVAVSAISAWTIGGAVDFTKPVHEIYVGDTGLAISAQASQTNSDVKVTPAFTYESASPSILITDASGNLYPVQPGTATVVVNYNNKPFDAIQVTVKATKVASDITLDTYGFSLSNQTVDNTKTVTVKSVDQYANATSVAVAPTVTQVITNQTGVPSYTTAAGTVTFDASNVTVAGLYPFKVTVGNFSKIVNVTVNVPSSTAAKDLSYKINLSATSFDLAVTSTVKAQSLTASIWAYAPNSVAVSAASLTSSTAAPTAANVFKLAIIAPDGTTTDAVTGTYALSTVSGTSITKAKVGTYTVVGYQSVAVGSAYTYLEIGRSTFTVVDTQTAPVLASVKSLVLTTVAAADIVNNFKFTWDGTEITAADIVSVNYVGDTSRTIYVNSVKIQKTINGVVITKDVNVGLNLTK